MSKQESINLHFPNSGVDVKTSRGAVREDRHIDPIAASCSPPAQSYPAHSANVKMTVRHWLPFCWVKTIPMDFGIFSSP